MICSRCGKEVQDDDFFCKHCGVRLVSEDKLPPEEAIRNVLIRRIDSIKKRDSKAIEDTIYWEKYTKFDDWKPFELQGTEGLESEAKALKVIKEYDYKTEKWMIAVFQNSAIAAFKIRYRGQIRDLKFNVQSRVTAFLIKREGKWKIVHEHWSRFPETRSSRRVSRRRWPF